MYVIKQREDMSPKIAQYTGVETGVDPINNKETVMVTFDVYGVTYSGTPEYYNEADRVKIIDKTSKDMIEFWDEEIKRRQEALNEAFRYRKEVIRRALEAGKVVHFDEKGAPDA